MSLVQTFGAEVRKDFKGTDDLVQWVVFGADKVYWPKSANHDGF